MTYLYAVVLLLLNTFALFLVVVGLPGNWLMVLFTAVTAWVCRDLGMFSPWTLAALAGVALLGEIAEFVAAAAGARKTGAGWRGSAGALFFGIVGGIVGTFAIPFPVLGSVLGACCGAFLGAVLGELSGGKDWDPALAAGRGAFTGRLLGTIYKLAAGVAIWIVALVASLL